MSLLNVVHVAVGVIQNQHGQILIAKRHKDSHQGGLWEFPGGKVEKNESILDALKREIFEELGIEFTLANPLTRIHHEYEDKSVILDVWKIGEFTGEAAGKEGQAIKWVNLSDLMQYEFPEANLPIIKSIQLPDKYLIIGHFKNEEDLLIRINNCIENGIKLVQFRAPNLAEEAFFNFAKKVFVRCEKKDVKLLLNTSYENYNKYQAYNFSDGLHLNSKEIKKFPLENSLDGVLISTSTHNYDELIYAENKKVDFVVLSPVKNTQSHPDSNPLGWDNFKSIADKSSIPVYALGGMNENDLKNAKTNGAQGIAAISAFWNILE